MRVTIYPELTDGLPSVVGSSAPRNDKVSEIR